MGKNKFQKKSQVSKNTKAIRKLKDAIDVEYKRMETLSTLHTVTNVGYVHALNKCATGTDAVSRDGLDIKMQNLFMRYHIEIDPLAVNRQVRMAIVYDKTPNGTKATWTEIFKESTIVTQTNSDHTGRFMILNDQTFTLDNISHGSYAKKLYLKLNKKTRYKNSGATDNDTYAGQLLLAVIGNVTANPSILHYTTRVRFTDD